MQAVHHIVIPAKRVVPEIRVQKNFRLKPLCFSRINIELRICFIFIRLSAIKIIQRMIHRPQDMLFPGRLRKLVPRYRVLEPSKLRIRIMSKRIRRTFRQEQPAVFQQLPADICLYHIPVIIQPQNLDRVGVAIEEQIDQLIERIDDRIRPRILILVK